MGWKKRLILPVLCTLFLNGCGPAENTLNAASSSARRKMNLETVTEVSQMKTYIYARQEILNGSEKVPMILFMCGTGCDPEKQPADSGFEDLVQKEDVIVVSPDYNNAAAYSETDRMADLVTYMKNHYPIDETRVYSLGFSNGGATSVALTSEHPELFAGIAAYGWMVDLKNKDNGYEMPFQVVQGTEEFITEDQNGNPAVMTDEQEAIHSLLVLDHMISEDTRADYAKTPYWGYPPSSEKKEMNNDARWTVSDYQKEGYQNPYVQFLLVDGSDHRPHHDEAEYSWNFLRHFRRNADGKITER